MGLSYTEQKAGMLKARLTFSLQRWGRVKCDDSKLENLVFFSNERDFIVLAVYTSYVDIIKGYVLNFAPMAFI